MSLRIPPLPPEVAPSVRALVSAANTFRHVLVASSARPLEEVLGDPPCVREDGQLVARERLVREDVAQDVAVAIGHFKRLYPGT